VPVDDGIRLIAKQELPERFHYMNLGGINRACVRHGLCLLRAAWWDHATAEARHAEFGSGDRRAWLRDLATARKARAICRLNDDQPGIARIASAIVDGDDRLIAIIGISGVAAAWTPEHCETLRAQVSQAASELTARLGFT
jgi:DNA-binding IclR family transcriptional regulator